MVAEKIAYEWSDAWLLLAIVYASREGEANIQRVIEIGDGINHAIFTEEELESGLSRLTSGGFVKESNAIFYPTSKVIKAYSQKTAQYLAVRR